MAKKTQGTQVYIIDPSGANAGDVLAIACTTGLNTGGAPRDSLDNTCLEDQAASFVAGLAKPGTASLGLNFDPSVSSHKRIFELWQSGDSFDMAIGWSDGTAAADVDSDGEFDLPTTRSWIVLHDTFFADCPLDAQLNSLWKSDVTIQKSGFPTIVPKST